MSARILLVEDNPANLELMSYLLRAFGYDVVIARDGEEGVRLALDDPPDLILLDLQLPKLTGSEALVVLRAAPRTKALPIVAVTAFAMVGDRERFLSEGFTGYLAKPIEPTTFVPSVEAFLPPGRRSGRSGVPR